MNRHERRRRAKLDPFGYADELFAAPREAPLGARRVMTALAKAMPPKEAREDRAAGSCLTMAAEMAYMDPIEREEFRARILTAVDEMVSSILAKESEKRGEKVEPLKELVR